MKAQFDCLYHLENKEISIFEIRRKDLPETATVAEGCQWFRFDKTSASLTPLLFRSSDFSGEIEERFFEQGYLKFNPLSGTYIEKFNSAQHSLLRLSTAELGLKLSKAVESYFTGR